MQQSLKHRCKNFTVTRFESKPVAAASTSLTVTLALLFWVGVVEKSLSVVSPGHAAELDPLQAIFKEKCAFDLEEVDLYPVGPAGAGSVRQVLPVLRECVSFRQWQVSV